MLLGSAPSSTEQRLMTRGSLDLHETMPVAAVPQAVNPASYASNHQIAAAFPPAQGLESEPESRLAPKRRHNQRSHMH